MSGGSINFDQIAQDAAARLTMHEAKRQQSTIVFPYLDLNAGIETSRAVYNARGHGTVETHELAAQMDQTISGAFRLKTGTARIFGLTERDGREGAKLSYLGRRIIEPETEREARAEAFMAVPLYSAVYEKYKGQRLPPPKALEREMIALGVSSKQADKARQAFERSARQAGYFEKGEDRLVRPYFDGSLVHATDKPDRDDYEDGGKKPKSGGGGDGDGGGRHPFIQGLLQTLPEPGSEWDASGRADWLGAAATMFKLIYAGDGNVTVTVVAGPERKTGNDQ